MDLTSVLSHCCNFLIFIHPKVQQSVLGDDHPTVLSTSNSIQFVDTARHCAANPQSHHAFFMNKAVAACTDENPADVMTEMLGINNIDSFSPKNWFVNPCGPVLYNPKDSD